MGELFSTKAKLLVYQHVMGKKLEGHAAQFAQPTFKQRSQILHDYDVLQKRLETGFMEKMGRALQGLWQLPMLEKAWIFFAILIPILLLKRIDGAVQIVWILPLLTVAYAVENRLQGSPKAMTLEERLFPSEAALLRDYLKEPLAPSLPQQQQQLERGWQIYLVREWAKEIPADREAELKKQVEKGDFAFNLARLSAIKNQPAPIDRKQESFGLLALYLFWNLSFALLVHKALRQESEAYRAT